MDARTQEEIVAKIRQHRSDAVLFDFTPEVLVDYLDWEHAKEFLKPEANAAEWMHHHVTKKGSLMYDFKSYMEFAWGKARDGRGLSAMRSVQKLTAWTWLLGRDDVLKQVEDTEYEPYGMPQLAVICKAFDFPCPAEFG